MRSHPKFSSPCAPPPPRRRVNSERLQQSRTRAALRCFTRTACTLWPRKVLIWRHFRSDSRRSSIGNGSAWAAHSSQFGRTGDSQSERGTDWIMSLHRLDTCHPGNLGETAQVLWAHHAQTDPVQCAVAASEHAIFGDALVVEP